MLAIHIILVFTSIISFIGRVILREIKPELLQLKLLKIAPHVIDTLLLLSGITLVILGGWFDREYGWILTKLLILLAYIGLGVVTMRSSGNKRWLAFAAAIACYGYVFVVAGTKQSFF